MSSLTTMMAELATWWSNRFTRKIERIRVRERTLSVEKLEHEKIDRTCYSPVLRAAYKADFEYKTHSQRNGELRRLQLKRLSIEERRQRHDDRLRRREEKSQRRVLAA